MKIASQEHQEQAPDGDLSLRDAARLYDVSARALAQQMRFGVLAGYKTRGAAGREWRVSRTSMEDEGYRRRGATGLMTHADELSRLREDLAAAQRLAAAERRRADDLDRRLGHALLESGRLRTALAAATGDAQATEAALDADAARWLIAAVTGGSGPRRRSGLSVGGVPTQS